MFICYTNFMSEAEQNPIVSLNREIIIELARQSVAKVYKQNPNALGFVIHGSRANERIEGKKQPREDSDLDVITIRSNRDDKASEELGNILWNHIGLKYNILVDTGPWGSLEWEEIIKAVGSQADRDRLRQEWKHLGDDPVVIGANPEVEAAVKKALLE